MAGDIHELAVSKIIDAVPGAQRAGFMAALLPIAFPENVLCRAEGLGLERFGFTVVPDAYRIDHETKTLTVFEVEDGHPLPVATMDKLCAIFRQLDGEEWSMFVETRNRWGEVTARIDMDEFSSRRQAQLTARRA